jgi:hypothetical protein
VFAVAAFMAKKTKRVFLFDLTAAEKANPSKRVAFSDRVPALEKSNDSVKDEDARNARAAIISVLDGLWRNPRLAVPCATWLSNRLQAESKPKGENYFCTAPAFLKTLETEWLAGFLVKHSQVSIKALEAVSVFDPDSPYQLLCFAIRCNLHCKFPDTLIDKELMGYVLMYLMKIGGNRLAGLTDAIMTTSGNGGIAWPSMGSYSFTWLETGYADRVTHRPTGDTVAVPVHSPIHTSFVLSKNWSDFEAAVVKKPSSIFLQTLFDDGKGPHRHKVPTGSSDIMVQAVVDAQLQQAALLNTKQTASGAASSGGFKADHKAAVQRQSIVKARKALENKKADLEMKRNVSLDKVGK